MCVCIFVSDCDFSGERRHCQQKYITLNAIFCVILSARLRNMKVRVQCAAQRPTVSPSFICIYVAAPAIFPVLCKYIHKITRLFTALLKFPSDVYKVQFKCSRRSTRMRWTNRKCRMYKPRKWELYLGGRMYSYLYAYVCVCVVAVLCPSE